MAEAIDRILQNINEERANISLYDKQLERASLVLAGKVVTGQHRTMSLESRKRISDARKAYFARLNKGKVVSITSAKKDNLTPAGRRSLSRKMKARWAKARRQGRTELVS